MICEQLAKALGFVCSPLNEEGNVALLTTPFKFSDGDPVPVYIEHTGSTFRVFDDGEVFLHFRGRGLAMSSKGEAKFITKAAGTYGASFTEDWILEASVDAEHAPEAFERYMNTIHAICAWEKENEGIDQDVNALVEEVATLCKRINPESYIEYDPQFKGISGRFRPLSLLVDGVGIAVVNTHHASISSALHNMLDIIGRPENSGKNFKFVIDDHSNPDKAKDEALILQPVATVQLLSSLERQATAVMH